MYKMPQSFPVHEKYVLPDTSSTAVCMTSEALEQIWSVNLNSEAYVGAASSGAAATGSGPFTVPGAAATGAGASTGTGVALTDALNSAVTQFASLASQAATSASNAATSASQAATSASNAAQYAAIAQGSVSSASQAAQLNPIVMAAAWDKTTPIFIYPITTDIPTSTLNIGFFGKSGDDGLSALKTKHEKHLKRLPAIHIFSAIYEHRVGNESQFPSEVALMNDCRLAKLTGSEFSFALTDSAGNVIHFFQGGKVFTQKVDGSLQMGGLVNCDPKEEKCPPSNKKILIEIVKDKSIIHFFEKLKNIAQSLHTSTVDSNNKIKHKVFGGLTQNNMLITSMPIYLREVSYGSIMAYTEIQSIPINN